MTPSATTARRARIGYSVAAVATLAVTVVFSTLGDGVEVPDAVGVRRAVVEFGHIAVWALLTAAFATAAFRGSWSRPSQWLAVAAGGAYALFLFAVFFWP